VVSCAAAGDCGAGRCYVDGSGSTQAFVVAENNGRWGKAREVLGTAALNGGRYAALDSDTLADAPGRQAAR
jgi:hypothetical protein